MQMNWVSYLINKLDKDCREAWDQGYEFSFSWLLILISLVIWKMLEGPIVEGSPHHNRSTAEEEGFLGATFGQKEGPCQ
jgi:hypothetical protein